MKILSIDTASDICGVSILENNKLLINLDTNSGRTHSENLLSMINKALEETKLTIKDINLLICDRGPGSFTGIRIGISTIKAFHDSLQIPYIGVSSLESLAYNIKNNLQNENYVASIIECKNNNCYYAIYQLINNQYQEIISPKAETIDNLQKNLLKYPNITLVGDGLDIYKEQFSLVKVKYSEDNLLNSYNLGLCGFDKYSNNNFTDILPLYLKKPQAQKQLEERMLKNNQL